jgi:hypothetical protein
MAHMVLEIYKNNRIILSGASCMDTVKFQHVPLILDSKFTDFRAILINFKCSNIILINKVIAGTMEIAALMP